MFKHDHNVKFYGIAMLLIITGVVIFVCGLLSWYIAILGGGSVLTEPSAKVIGGFIIMALGYIVLELELLRKK